MYGSEKITESCVERSEEFGKQDILSLPYLKTIDNSNLKDWSCIRRINGQIRLKEEKDQIMKRNGNEKWTLPRKSLKKLPRN